MEIINSLAQVILVIILGYIFKIRNFISLDTVKQNQKIVLTFMLPISIFLSFTATDFTLDKLILPLLLALSVLLMYFLAKGIKSLLKINYGFFQTHTSLFEGGLVGYILFPILFPLSLSEIVSIDFGQAVIAFGFIFPTLNMLYKSEIAKKSLKTQFLDFIKNPIIAAIILGILFSIFKVFSYIPEVYNLVNTAGSFLALPSSVLILLGLGYQLSFKKLVLKKAFVLAIHRIIITAIGLVFFLSAAYFIGVLTRDTLFIVIFLFTLPPSFLINSFFENQEENEIVSTSTSFSVIFTLITFVILYSLYN